MLGGSSSLKPQDPGLSNLPWLGWSNLFIQLYLVPRTETYSVCVVSPSLHEHFL